MNEQEEAKKLAEEHWAYIRGLLNLHEVAGREVIGWHYKTAFIHGYKHGAAAIKTGKEE